MTIILVKIFRTAPPSCHDDDVNGLTAAQRARYGRHVLLPEIGAGGQRRLLDASVAVVGAGGLGSAVLAYLAAAGIGRITIVDDDVVDASNLQRQVLHTTDDLGRPKTDSAAARIAALNPEVRVTTHRGRLDADSVWDVLGGHDAVVDCTDNFPTRYLLSDACAVLGLPDVWAAVHRFDAAVSVFRHGHGPCYRCLHPLPPEPGAVPSCAQAGVLGALPGVVGSVQALETIKVLLGIGRPLLGRLASYDALDATWRTIDVAPGPRCPVCGPAATIRTREDVSEAHPPPVHGTRAEDSATAVDATAARALVADGALLLDVRTPEETALHPIDGALTIPLDELPHRIEEIPHGAHVVAFCARGPRSTRAAALLAPTGRPTRWLTGGADAWPRDRP